VSGFPCSLSTLNTIPVGLDRHVYSHQADHRGVITKTIGNHINIHCIVKVRLVLYKLQYLDCVDISDIIVQLLPFYTLQSPTKVSFNNNKSATDYIREQWIGDRTERPRTTNNRKVWHRKLKKKVQHGHHRIFIMIQTLK
jgi:hypothetical protein